MSAGVTVRDVNTQSAKTELLYSFWTNDKLKLTSRVVQILPSVWIK